MTKVFVEVALVAHAVVALSAEPFYSVSANEPDDLVTKDGNVPMARYSLSAGDPSVRLMRYNRMFGEFERAELTFALDVPADSGVTGACARVSTFPGTQPCYDRGKTFDTTPVSVSGSGRLLVTLPLDIREFRAKSGTAAFPSRLDGLFLLRRTGAPACEIGLGDVLIKEAGLRTGFSVGNGRLAVGDLTRSDRNDPHLTVSNDGSACDAVLTWRAYDPWGDFERKGRVERRLADGARVRVDLPRLDRCGVLYLDYTLTKSGDGGFSHRREISYGAMRPTGSPSAPFTDGFHFNNTMHITVYPMEEIDEMLDYYAAAGYDMARAGGDYMLYVAPSQGEWRTRRSTALTRKCLDRNIERTMCLMCPATWQREGAPCKVESLGYPNLSVYEDYCERFVREMKGLVRMYEDANEINHHKGWTPTNYCEYEKAAYRGLKKGNPAALLLSGSWGGMHGGQNGIADFQEAYYRDCNHGEYDVLAVHYHGDFESGFNEMFAAKKIADAQRKPWFAHECASAPIEDPAAAKILFQKTFHAWANGSIGFTWYNFRNKGYPRLEPVKRGEISFGQISHDLYPRGTYIAQNAICGAYRGARFVSEVSIFPDVMSWRFETAEAALFPAWAMGADFVTRTVAVKTDCDRAESVDLYGNVRSLPVKDGIVMHDVGTVPSTLRLFPASCQAKFLGAEIVADRQLVLTAGAPRKIVYTIRNPRQGAEKVRLTIKPPKGVSLCPQTAELIVPAVGKVEFVANLKPSKDYSSTAETPQTLSVEAKGETMDARTVFAVQPLSVCSPSKPVSFSVTRRENYTSLAEGDFTADDLNWKDASDLAFWAFVFYPENGKLQIRVCVNDDVHRPEGDGHFLFMGDGLQLMLNLPGQSGGWEIGVRTDQEEKGGAFHVWRAPAECDGEALAKNITLTMSRNLEVPAKTLWYNVYLPLDKLGVTREQLLSGTMRLNVLVNDNDGKRREGYMSLIVGNPWNSDAYPSVVFEEN